MVRGEADVFPARVAGIALMPPVIGTAGKCRKLGAVGLGRIIFRSLSDIAYISKTQDQQRESARE
jgi:hypothetical protein